MSRNDTPPPGQDPDGTIMVPRPGGRRAAPGVPQPGSSPGQPVPVQSMPAQPYGGTPAAPMGGYMPNPATPASSGPVQVSGLNPLVRAANPLLSLVVPLRHMSTHSDLEDLRARLVQGIRRFEAEARGASVTMETLAAARYALCTLLDETVSSTPWGGGGVWSSRSLLVTFHNEASGGEKFFLILQRLAQDPRANIDALELFYVCLALGMEGRYRLVAGGRDQLDQLRERLLQLIRQNRGQAERDLSPRWQGVVDKRNPLLRVVPLWVMAAVAGVILVVLHLVFSMSLAGLSDPVFAALHNVKVAIAAPAIPKAPAAPPAPRLATFLAPEVQQGLVTVNEVAGKSTVTLRGDGMFASGSAELQPSFLPVLSRIADALKTVPGRVLVVGHTDDQRIVSARYPSNWHLSQARAQAVMQILAERLGSAQRLSAEGRADTEPLVPNDSPANRARNRRVDVIVFTGES